jgi:spermidine synthase
MADRLLVLFFALAMSASAFLLFVVQPMFARMVLPSLGGSPSVWTTCMLFFQSALLIGYLYAHGVTRYLRPRASMALHGILLLAPLPFLPLHVPAAVGSASELQPAGWLLGIMVASVGIPFAILATTAPLLQRYFAWTRHASARDPYFLYAASNAGSLVALIAYPTLVEPGLTLPAQSRGWAGGYVAAAALILGCVALVWTRARDERLHGEPVVAGETPAWRQRLSWLLLACVPSSLLLGVTTYLTTDLASVPLLWIVPLVIYLVAFIIAFASASERSAAIAARVFPLVLLPLVTLMIARGGAPLWFAVPLHLLTFAATSVLCLGRLSAMRPPTAHLTEFYLWIAAGGAVGGVINSLLAPALFTSVTEYPLMLAAACFLLAWTAPAGNAAASWRHVRRPLMIGLLTSAALALGRMVQLDPREIMLLLGAPALLCFSLSRQPWRFAIGISFMLGAAAIVGTAAWGRVLHAERTFFGVYRVSEDRAGRFVTLYHGTTVHGRQRTGSSAPEPLTYYHRRGPIGDVLGRIDENDRSIGVVGLGVGSLAAYERPGDRWTFYELDPAVERLARDARYFRFLAACGNCAVTIGDARLSLERSSASHDLLVIDAFSSDAVPVHLLTREAFTTYAARLSPGGLLAFHVSNRHVDLRPVLARLARDLQMTALARFDAAGEDPARGYSASDWVVMGRNSRYLAALEPMAGWTALGADSRASWSDHSANLWAVLRWRSP